MSQRKRLDVAEMRRTALQFGGKFLSNEYLGAAVKVHDRFLSQNIPRDPSAKKAIVVACLLMAVRALPCEVFQTIVPSARSPLNKAVGLGDPLKLVWKCVLPCGLLAPSIALRGGGGGYAWATSFRPATEQAKGRARIARVFLFFSCIHTVAACSRNSNKIFLRRFKC